MTLDDELALVKQLFGEAGSLGAPCVIVGWHDVGRFTTITLGSQNDALVRSRVANARKASRFAADDDSEACERQP
jgi:hypothetical protein